LRKTTWALILALAFLTACDEEGETDPAAAWLEGFHQLRVELIIAAGPFELDFLTWHRAGDAEAAGKALAECRAEAKKLLPLLAAQTKTVKGAEVPKSLTTLKESFLACLEGGTRGVKWFLEATAEPSGDIRGQSAFSPTGDPARQHMLHDQLQAVLGDVETEPEKAAADRIRKEIARSRTIDKPLRRACRLWGKAETSSERGDAVRATILALRGMESALVKQYIDLVKLEVPPRHRDLAAALREAVRLELLVCRRLPEAFLAGDNRSIGMWTSVMNDVLNPKARMAGVNPLDEVRGETEDE